jgi:hypothetical protein
MQIDFNHVVSSACQKFGLGICLEDFNEFIDVAGNKDWHEFSLHFVKHQESSH